MIRLTIVVITPKGYIRNHFRYGPVDKKTALMNIKEWVNSGMNIYPEDACYVDKDLNSVFVQWIENNDIFSRDKLTE